MPHGRWPRGTGYTVLAVVGLYALLPAIALSAMPVTQEAGEFTTELGTEYADDPVLGIVENIGLGAGLTEALEIYVGILAAVILLIATNAALIGLSRLTFSMGQHRQVPEALRQVHPRFKTPYMAIIVFSAVAVVVMLPGSRPSSWGRSMRSGRRSRSRSRTYRSSGCRPPSPPPPPGPGQTGPRGRR